MVALEKGMVKVREHAELVEAHGDDVDKALGVNNSALDLGTNWEQLDEIVEHEKANMNPIALLIKQMNLDRNEIVLSLTRIWDHEKIS